MVVTAPPPCSALPLKQSVGPESKLVSAKSPLVGLPKKPLSVNVLSSTASPHSSNRQLPDPSAPMMPPVHGLPLSRYGTMIMPQAPLFSNVLSMTVSLRPPDSDMPVPTGPAAAEPAAGTFGLLLSWT